MSRRPTASAALQLPTAAERQRWAHVSNPLTLYSAMKPVRAHVIFGDLGVLALLAVGRLVLHTVTNSQYGFHRDELAMLDDARYLAWGYVAYPPMTPLIGRVALMLFGPSLVGVRFFSALAQSIAMLLAGLITRELDGTRLAQMVTALAVALAPISLLQGALFQVSPRHFRLPKTTPAVA
jgi:hypothetical protein